MKLLLTSILIFVLFCNITHAQKQGQELIDSLVAELPNAIEDTSKVNLLNELSKFAGWRAHNYDTAFYYAQHAKHLAEKLNFKKGIANAYNNIGITYNIQRSLPEALENYLASLKIREEIGDKLGTANSYNNIGNFHYYQGNYTEALKNHFASLKIMEERSDKPGVAKSYYNIGIIYLNQGNYPEALKISFAALKIREEIGDKYGIANTLDNIGLIYIDQGNLTEALKTLLASLKIKEEIGDRHGMGISYVNIGNVYTEQKNFPEAIKNYRSQLKIGEEIADKYVIALSYYNIGVIHTEQGNYTEALKNHLAALKLREEILEKNGIADSYNSIGSVYVKQGNAEVGKDWLMKGLKLGEEVGLKKAIRFSYLQLVAADSALGNYKGAYINYKMYTLYKDSLFNEENTKKLTQAEMQYEFDKKETLTKVEHENQKAAEAKTRNLLFGGIALLTLAAGFLFWNSRQKQKAKLKVETAYSELKATQQQLIQSEKMASLGELTAGIAHEIQNPLNFVNNFSEVSTELVDEMNEELEKGNSQDAKQIAADLKQNLGIINHHGKRAGDIVKGMLQHSRSSSGVEEPTDINALADEYLRLAYHGLRAKDKSFNATMKTEFDESIGKINVVPQDIGRVILNLITNAFYAVTDRKKQGEDGYEPTVTVSTKLLANSQLLIAVKDNGNGIPDHIKDKIFQPFFTTKPTGQGTGLGLSLSYDIVKAHGGKIEVETKENEGTTFFIQLKII